MTSFVGVVVAVIIFIVVLVYRKLTCGYIFGPDVSFKDDFPEELKSFVKENIRYFHPNRIQELLQRYKEAKDNTDFADFYLEVFLNKENELIKQRKKYLAGKKQANKNKKCWLSEKNHRASFFMRANLSTI